MSQPPMTERPAAGDVLVSLAGVAGLAASVTVIFLAMRAVMDIGGTCAEGGPYQIQTHCPAIGSPGPGSLDSRRTASTGRTAATANAARAVEINRLRRSLDSALGARQRTMSEEDGLVSRLERLAELHRSGALTDAEFEAAKRQSIDDAGRLR